MARRSLRNPYAIHDVLLRWTKPLFILAFALVVGIWMYRGYSNLYFLVVIGAISFLLQLYMSFRLSMFRLDEWSCLGGQFGEIALSTLTIVAF
ncbi:MAG: hypothetical protein R3A47_12055 [Polyangiales bacterium]